MINRKLVTGALALGLLVSPQHSHAGKFHNLGNKLQGYGTAATKFAEGKVLEPSLAWLNEAGTFPWQLNNVAPAGTAVAKQPTGQSDGANGLATSSHMLMPTPSAPMLSGYSSSPSPAHSAPSTSPFAAPDSELNPFKGSSDSMQRATAPVATPVAPQTRLHTAGYAISGALLGKLIQNKTSIKDIVNVTLASAAGTLTVPLIQTIVTKIAQLPRIQSDYNAITPEARGAFLWKLLNFVCYLAGQNPELLARTIKALKKHSIQDNAEYALKALADILEKDHDNTELFAFIARTAGPLVAPKFVPLAKPLLNELVKISGLTGLRKASQAPAQV